MTTVYFKFMEELAIGHRLADEDLLDFIKEQLYLFWELVPSNDDWRVFFKWFNSAHFERREGEYFTMECKPLKADGSEVMVTVREGL